MIRYDEDDTETEPDTPTDPLEEPPAYRTSGHGSRWAPRLDVFRRRPGVWHRLDGTHSPALAHRIKSGLITGVVAGEFEVTSRSTEDPESTRRYMWVRYVGLDDTGTFGDIVDWLRHLDQLQVLDHVAPEIPLRQGNHRLLDAAIEIERLRLVTADEYHVEEA